MKAEEKLDAHLQAFHQHGMETSEGRKAAHDFFEGVRKLALAYYREHIPRETPQHREVCEDLAAETVRRAYLNAHKLRPPAANWARVVMKRAVIDRFNYLKRRGEWPVSMDAPLETEENLTFHDVLASRRNTEKEVETRDRFERVLSAIGQVVDPETSVLVLKHLHNLETREIAAKLKVSESFVRKRLMRERKKLRDELARQGYFSEDSGE